MSNPALSPILTLASLGFRFDLLAAHPVGSGAAYSCRVDPAARKVDISTRVPGFSIEETGVVECLLAKNPGDLLALVPSNLILEGGKQTRIVERSVLLGSRSDVRIPVKCVERGRWSPDLARPDRFDAHETSSVMTRSSIYSMKAESYRTSQTYAAPQSEVWAHVDSELEGHGVASRTSSYGAYVTGVRSKHVHAARTTVPELHPEANGLLLLGAGWMAFEAFAHPAALRDRAASLMADLLDPTLRSSLDHPHPQNVLFEVGSAPLDPIVVVDGTLGESYALVHGRMRGEVLMLEGRLAHASIVG